MRILSCYVAGFGRLVEQRFDFTQNPTVIKADNGWGKTTLAAFLESMLFGLDASRNKSLSENPRVKYEPWSGGAFGGSLVFEVGGEKYRIERSFGKTPSADNAKIYDKNNMLFYGFGDRAERLGEALFGVDRESYRKTAYIPQGEAWDTGMPQSLKSRLTALLSVDERAGGARGDAVARLDEAERALRAKRRPAKGKLDEIDERLETLRKERLQCQEAKGQAGLAQGEIARYDMQLAELDKEIQAVFKRLGNCPRQGERAAQEELRATLNQAQAEIERLEYFFGGNDPAALSTEEVQEDVVRFYAQTEGAGTRSNNKKRGKRWLSAAGFIVGLAAAAFGGAILQSNPLTGILLLFLGGAGALSAIFPSMWKKGKRGKNKETQTRESELDVAAIEGRIRAFFGRFRFEEIYDYRAALSTLKEKQAQYFAAVERAQRCEEKLSVFTARFEEERRVEPLDEGALNAQKAVLEQEKTRLMEVRGRALAALAIQEERANRESEYAGEETRLFEEKTRLEKRLTAIRAAREILVRARENTAARFLQPVEKNCRKYAEILRGDGKRSNLIFTAEGNPVLEENGSLRQKEYYSVGLQELYGLSTRLALFEAVFVKETPPLVLDDPFVNLDDRKTEKAKVLLKELSKQYQIVYFTCKTERSL